MKTILKGNSPPLNKETNDNIKETIIVLFWKKKQLNNKQLLDMVNYTSDSEIMLHKKLRYNISKTQNRLL